MILTVAVGLVSVTLTHSAHSAGAMSDDQAAIALPRFRRRRLARRGDGGDSMTGRPILWAEFLRLAVLVTLAGYAGLGIAWLTGSAPTAFMSAFPASFGPMAAADTLLGRSDP